MPGSFDTALLKMVKMTNGYVVFRAPVCWKQPPLKRFWFLKVDPDEEDMPLNQPYRIENCVKVGQTMRAELVFETAINNIHEWHQRVFEASREVKLVMKFDEEFSSKLPVKHICWSHESLVSVAYEAEYQTTQAAKAVGVAVDYALSYPFRRFRNGANEHSELM